MRAGDPLRGHGRQRVYAGWQEATLPPAAVGGRAAALDEADLDEPLHWLHVKENPPIADPPAKGGRLILEALHVAREGILSHLFECRVQALPLRPWGAPEPFLGGLSYLNDPGATR